MSSSTQVHDRTVHLDVTADVCPITWVRTKLALEAMGSGEVLSLRLNAGEALRNVPMSAKEEGHRILAVADNDDETYTLAIRKDGLS